MVIKPEVGKLSFDASGMTLSPNAGAIHQQQATVKLTQPVSIDGTVVSNIVSEILWEQGQVSLRNLGRK